MFKRRHKLDVIFRSREKFEREYATNIANGGIFVETDAALEVRRKVEVRVKLTYAKKGVALRGEVVHVVGAELAVTGASPGVAVHFEAPAGDLRALFEPLLAREEEAAATEVQESPDAGEADPSEEARQDRRGAPRSRARVHARVECPGSEIVAGRTRDLSITGVLVSIGSTPAIDVGERVKVTIAHPETGTEREILGKVVRHVKGAGSVVRAIGVHFHIRDSERKSIEHFLRDLTSTEHTRHLGGIQGAIAELGLVNLVQTFGQAAREGTLDVINGAEEGYLAFEDGCLRAAGVGGTLGVKALARMLSWTDGTFEFHARIDPALPEAESTPLDAAILEAMCLMDESADVDRGDFPPQAVLEVDRAERDAAEGLSKLEDAILDLAAAGMNVQRILDIVPETDSEIYVALWNLAEREILSAPRS